MKHFRFSIPVFTVLSFGMMLVGCSTPPQSAQAKIDKMASEMKSQLPKTLDSDTKLVDVYTSKLELVSKYELSSYPDDEDGREEMRHRLGAFLNNQVCMGIKKELLRKGISSRYIYQSQDGETILDVVLRDGDC